MRAPSTENKRKKEKVGATNHRDEMREEDLVFRIGMSHKFLCNIRTPRWGHRTIFDIVQRPDSRRGITTDNQRLNLIQGGSLMHA